jgi:hypothetical protein
MTIHPCWRFAHFSLQSAYLKFFSWLHIKTCRITTHCHIMQWIMIHESLKQLRASIKFKSSPHPLFLINSTNFWLLLLVWSWFSWCWKGSASRSALQPILSELFLYLVSSLLEFFVSFITFN